MICISVFGIGGVSGPLICRVLLECLVTGDPAAYTRLIYATTYASTLQRNSYSCRLGPLLGAGSTEAVGSMDAPARPLDIGQLEAEAGHAEIFRCPVCKAEPSPRSKKVNMRGSIAEGRDPR
jgi:hypothetical protein